MTADNAGQRSVIDDRPESLATPADVAAYLNTTVDGLAQMRYRREGPPYIKVGRKILYDWTDVNRWIEANKQGTVR